MSRINSRNKGSKAERKAASLFTGWTDLKFSRTPSSGGLNWKATNVSGDIVCTEEGEYFPFCVEIKFHAQINFAHLLYDVKSDIIDFWNQCNNDAIKAGKIPLLMMRYNGMPSDTWFIMMEYTHWRILDSSKVIKKSKMFTYRTIKGKHVIINSNDFFNTKYSEVYKLLIPLTNYGRKLKTKS